MKPGLDKAGADGHRLAVLDTNAAFVLFDDARTGGAGEARLYRRPAEIIEARDPADVAACLDRLAEAQARGLHAAGFLAYAAGHALEPRLAPLGHAPSPEALPLLWFGLFDACERLSASDVPDLLADPAGAWSGEPRPLIERDDYLSAVARVKRHIEAGDIYQANLTFQTELPFAGDPLALYTALRGQAAAGHGGILFTGTHWLLCFSPELFFTFETGTVTARPMKGTAVRRADPNADEAAAHSLRADEKQRAENLMIVDLIRNDLSRVSVPGTVAVPSLFEVETYPTIHQMTSTVTARAEQGIGAANILRATFPCGSITGAPKIRAMEIIADVEQAPRGAYTGSIGWIAPDGDAAFNVAIRTLSFADGGTAARLGLGSGIVADSRAEEEWRECLAKGRFAATRRRFDLIETMRFDPQEGLPDLDRHLARLKRSAAALGFAFNRHGARNELQAATFRLRELRLVRLLLSPSGAIAIETRALPSFGAGPVTVALRPMPVDSSDFRLHHKTTDRSFYEAARRDAGTAEILFTDRNGRITEGSFTNVFVKRGARLLTPPLARGLLPGILRERLIDEGHAEEADLTPDDLAKGFFIGNAARGLTPAVLSRSPSPA